MHMLTNVKQFCLHGMTNGMIQRVVGAEILRAVSHYDRDVWASSSLGG